MQCIVSDTLKKIWEISQQLCKPTRYSDPVVYTTIIMAVYKSNKNTYQSDFSHLRHERKRENKSRHIQEFLKMILYSIKHLKEQPEGVL